MSVLPDEKDGMLELVAGLEGWSRPVVLVDSVGSEVYFNGHAKRALDLESTGLDGDAGWSEALKARLGEAVEGLGDTPSELDLGFGGVGRWLASVIRRGDGQRVGTMLSAVQGAGSGEGGFTSLRAE